jgi:peptidoglycan/xylan/chitin deacetylase (PgdA/CDA1 family)
MKSPRAGSNLLAMCLSALMAAACGGTRLHSPGSPVAPRPRPSASPSLEAPPTSSPKPSPTVPRIPSSLVGTQWYELPTTEKVVALTFDAGANADAVASILQTLADKGVPATFFLTGKWVEVYPEYAAEIGATYPVANHSDSHPDLTTLSDAEVRDEITKGAVAIKKATGRDTHPMFRFPFGASDAGTISIVNSLGYGAINWTVDTRGWQGTSGGQSVASIVDRVLAALQPGEIVIMHVGSNPDDHSTLDADALPHLIDEILARGYTFVTVDQYL